MTNEQDKPRSDRSVHISGSVHGSSIVTGDHNKVVTHTRVQHPPAESVDIRAELATIRAALAELQAPDRDRLDNALKEAEDEAARDKPRPDEIGDALGRAVKYASRAAGFAAAMDRLRPHVTNAAAWLGTHGSTLLRTLGL